jgi:predicted DNA-binding transcriptional regulator AlpA
MQTDIPPLERIAVTIPQAAMMIGLSRSKLYTMIATGALETRRIGRRRIVLVASLRKLIETSDSGPPSTGGAAPSGERAA